MGEHGPHAVVLGPDGWLYHNLGNHAWIQNTPEPTTPCRNWEEGNLLEPAFEDAGGHAVGIKAPGGTIWRFSPDGKKWWAETNGFRNHYDICFNQQGDLFTFDSDMEWDVNLPWYRPIRVNHCIPGAEFGWRSGAKIWPDYYFDSLPTTVDIGRGSPTGVAFYEHTQFPEKYRGAMLNCDWSMGRIIIAGLERDGATYKGKWENLVTGNPLNVSDIEVDRDGSVVFCTGGRGTEGGIYRVSYAAGRNSRWRS
jgi:glucose/arabinose dehydrogenase